MHVSEPRRTLPRLFAMLLVSAAVAVVSVPAARSADPARSIEPAARTAPTDVYRGQQWTLGALHVQRAWHYSRGSGVTVAVLDTGVDGHQPDLVGRVIDGPDYTGHVRRPGGRYWGRHGTQMASIIVGHGHGPGGSEGIMGVAPDARILSIRVTWELNDPMRTDHAEVDGSRDAIAEGIRYATDHGAQVISMSLGGGKLFYDGNPMEESAISYALSKGVVLVASAGNDGGGPNRRNYPAAYPGVIAVGAVDRTFKPAKFTNRHTYVSVAAPGVEIVSADVSGQGYVLGTGTSPSAAFVAGISALVKARYPRLTPAEVKDAIEEGATHRPPDGRDTSVGTGVADALGAIRAAAQINKAEHGGAAVRQPPTPPATTAPRPAPAANSGVDLMLVAVLSGGGTLMLLSIILGWRQRRRRLAAERAGDEDVDDEFESPVHAGVSARRSPPGTPRGARPAPGSSPWEPRSADTSPWESPSPDRSPWEPRSSGERRSFDAAPWGSRPAGADRPPETSAWETPDAESPPDSVPPAGPSWPADSASSWRSRLPGASSSESRRADAASRPNGRSGPASMDDDRTEGSSWGAGRAEPASLREGRADGFAYEDGPIEGSSWRRPDTTSEPGTGPENPPAGQPDQAARHTPAGTGHRPHDSVGPRSGPGRGPVEPALTEPFHLADPPPAGPPGTPGIGSAAGPETPPHADGSPGGTGGGRSPAESAAFDLPSTAGVPPARRPAAPRSPEPHEPASSGERPDGGQTGGFPALTQDFRAVDASDPLSDGPIESSYDVGTPLAEQSWESIRRGFDRLKEDTRNWGSAYRGIGTGLGFPAGDSGQPEEPPGGDHDDAG